MQGMSWKAKAYIGLTLLTGLTVLVLGLTRWDCPHPARFIGYLLVSCIAAGLKVRLPGIAGALSVNFLFILVGMIELGFSEVLLMGCAGSVAQCLWKSRSRARPIQVLFSVSTMANAAGLSYWLYNSVLEPRLRFHLPVELGLAACVFFVANTLPVAAVVAWTEEKRLGQVWKQCYFWSFPYYLFGAALAALLSALNHWFGWETALLVLPFIYWMYYSYSRYLERLERGKKHVEEMAGLHLRTIEALALAIEAKDYTTHSHLRRVGLYALEIGKELGLSPPELEALRAAALLHDIGKLAVPEHIVSKPGKLTPVEFDKMKIHPIIGAEIIEQVGFPYPVAPIVRAHHEKWDGSGYPAGLRGEEIPIGARILSAVDCLDAISSDRQYRRALPLDEAMERVAAEAGKSFDPRVVEVLARRYRDLEKLVQAHPVEKPKLSRDLTVVRGWAPAAGFAETEDGASHEYGFMASIVSARQEAQALFELSQTLGNSLSLDETLSVLGLRLKRLIPYDSIAVYVRRDNRLAPEYVSGESFRLFSSLEIPIGEGLSGWVAANRKPIVNGNPAVESAYLNDPGRRTSLWSALSVPLQGANGLIGVLTLYHSEKDFFTPDHLRVLLAITEKITLAMENALKYRLVESSAATDALTGLPNARSLFLHLDRELARCKRTRVPLAVLVCDLDGFKKINDRYGHMQGNKALQAVAGALQQACREYDYVARMGGDEFVIILPGQSWKAVEAQAARLAQLTEKAGREICREGCLQLSIGAAFYPDDGAGAEQLLSEADRRMYQAKRKPLAGGTLRELECPTSAVH